MAVDGRKVWKQWYFHSFQGLEVKKSAQILLGPVKSEAVNMLRQGKWISTRFALLRYYSGKICSVFFFVFFWFFAHKMPCLAVH